jgi:hypothetical protein
MILNKTEIKLKVFKKGFAQDRGISVKVLVKITKA